MVVNWLRENKVAAGILTVLRLYLGYSWITAGFHKLSGRVRCFRVFKRGHC